MKKKFNDGSGNVEANAESLSEAAKREDYLHNQKAEASVEHGWFSLGQGRGIKWTLWKTSVTFQRQEKQGDQWITLEELHVAPKVLKEFAWRSPIWLSKMCQDETYGGVSV